MTLESNFAGFYAAKLSGHDIDEGMIRMCGRAVPSDPLLTCPVGSLEELIWMAQSASACIQTASAQGALVLSAVYLDVSCYPAPRHYYFRQPNPSKWAAVLNIASSCGLSFVWACMDQFVRQGDWSQITREFQDLKDRSIPEAVRKLIAGRSLFTTVEKTIFVNSDTCLCCDRPDPTLVTSTIGGLGSIFILYYLCAHCLSDAQGAGVPIWDFVSQKLGAASLGPFDAWSLEDSMDEIRTVLQEELLCRAISQSKKTIKAVRRSGFTLIFRLDSPHDYAYMILNQAGKEVARFDSANHHLVDAGPHHLHFDTTTKKAEKVVCPSYFIGCPLFDMPGFKALVELKERA